MSVRKTADDGNISIFTKKGVSVYSSHNMQGQSHSHWKAQRAGQIQNTTRPKSRQLATIATNKELQEIYSEGQQCLRPPLYQRSDQVDACGLWVPSQLNMAQGGKGRKLHWLAAPHRMERQQILPRNHRNPKRAHESNTKEPAINKNQTHNMGTTGTVPSQRTQHITTHGQESARCIHVSMTYAKQYSPTGQAGFPRDPNEATNT